MVKWRIWILTSDQRSEVNCWPLRGQIKQIISFLKSLAKKTYISISITVKWGLLSFDLQSEVRGQLVASERSNKKNDIIFGLLDQKTYIVIYIMVKWWIWIFNLWSEVKGQLVASERSNKKNSAIFELLDPKNLCFNIHHDKMMTLDFWPLIRGQRSFDGLWEVRIPILCSFMLFCFINLIT